MKRENDKLRLGARAGTPMMVPSIAFLAGIAGAQIAQGILNLPCYIAIHLSGILLAVIFICTGCFVLCLSIPRYASLRYKRFQYILALGILFFTGAWCYYGQNEDRISRHHSQPVTLYAQVRSITPTSSGRYMRLNCRLIAFQSQQERWKCRQTLFIYIPTARYDSAISRGAKILTITSISSKENPLSAFLRNTDPLSYTSASPSFPEQWQRKLLSHLQKHIRDTASFALLSGLSIGNKESLTPELKNAYAATGAMHVLAVSGLHVGIIYAIILFSFNLMLPGNDRKRDIIKKILILCTLTLFSALAGFTASVTRALLMTTLFISGRLLQRPVGSLQTLFSTALLICIQNPSALFEVGFQLSFCAVFAIVTLQPLLQNLLHPKNKILQYIWSLSTVSTAAQAGTSILAYYYFGSFPYLFLLTNFWVIPLTGLLLYLLCAWLLLGAIPGLGPLLLWLLEQMAWLMNQGVLLIDSFC